MLSGFELYPRWVPLFSVRPRMLSIYTNSPGGNLGHKHKSLKFDVMRVRTATKYIKVY